MSSSVPACYAHSCHCPQLTKCCSKLLRLPCREAEIQKKLELADKRIAEYRAAQHAPMREASLMDRILLTPSQIRLKAKGG